MSGHCFPSVNSLLFANCRFRFCSPVDCQFIFSMLVSSDHCFFVFPWLVRLITVCWYFHDLFVFAMQFALVQCLFVGSWLLANCLLRFASLCYVCSSVHCFCRLSIVCLSGHCVFVWSCVVQLCTVSSSVFCCLRRFTTCSPFTVVY